MKFLVLGNAHRPGVAEEAERLLPVVEQHGEIVLVDLYQEQDLRDVKADMTLVLGGDGAILRAARQMGYQQIPVLGINLGKLGFLADLSPEHVVHCLPEVAQGEFQVRRHLMFECLVEGPDKEGSTLFLGLNEITLQTGPPFHMIDLDLVIGGETISRYTGDGLIISTPIGSTAHNLSAGGPILEQGLFAFVITPICPHALTSRPLVDSADKTYTICINRADGGTTLVIDGQERVPLTTEHRVTIRKAPVTFGLVKLPGRSYYQTLRDKLRWGTPPNYRQESRGKA
jgi:NAD+ kinase